MKALVISDIHNDSEHLYSVVQEGIKSGIETIIGLWDYIAKNRDDTSINEEVFEILNHLDMEKIFIFWNWDAPKERELRERLLHWKGRIYMPTCIQQEIFKIQLDTRKLLLSHYYNLVKSQNSRHEYDAVFGWHTHIQETEVLDTGTVICNPGSVLMDRWSKWSTFRYALYDTENNEVELKKLHPENTTTP